MSWNNLRANLHLWTPEIANAKPYREGYHIKYDMCRFTYCMSRIHTHYESTKAVKGKTKNTHDHILGSSLVGECVLDNSDIFLKDEKGFDKMFELYLHGLLVTFVTKEENDLLAQLRGKFLTKDKYNEVGIVLQDKEGNQVIINGSGSIQAIDLLSRRVDAKINGSGNIELFSINNPSTKINGSGNIHSYGPNKFNHKN